MITFTVPGLPVAQPRQRHTRSGFNFTPAKHPVNAFKAAVRLAWPDGATAACGAVRMCVRFYLPKPATKVRKRDAGRRLWVATRPDVDNLSKSVLDALAGLAWRDDSQVAELIVSKQYVVTDDTGSCIDAARCDVTITDLVDDD
jgi:Holliday junction resolvase RusA-like endonuclease